MNPANEQVIGRLASAGRQDLDGRHRSGREGLQSVEPDRATGTGPMCCAGPQRSCASARPRSGAPSPLELGKPYHQAKLEVIRGCEFFEWDAGEAVRTYGRVIPQRARHQLHRAPAARGPGGRLLAVELPDEPTCPQGGGRAGGGMLDHPQALGGDPGGRHAHRPGVPRCRPAAGRAEPGLRRAVPRYPST